MKPTEKNPTLSLKAESVLKNAITEGVQRGTFGMVKEGKVAYGEAVPLDEIIRPYWSLLYHKKV